MDFFPQTEMHKAEELATRTLKALANCEGAHSLDARSLFPQEALANAREQI